MTRSTLKLTALTACAALISAPAMAQVYYTPESQAAYEDCKRKDTQNQVIGGVVGGLLGGVLGNEIEEGEGTVIGGAAGAYAGTRIANKDCEALLVRDDYARTTYDQDAYTTYDVRSGQYIDTRTGAVVTAEPRSDVAGAVTYNQNGMVRVTDEDGSVFFVSQADYDRFYR